MKGVCIMTIINEERIAMLMKKLSITREEALELEGYDDDVNHNRKTEYDLTEEQRQNVIDMNRKRDHKKTGPHEIKRKPNPTKEGIVASLADFLENECEFILESDVIYCGDVEITNKNRMIHFTCNGNEYDLQLIEKRKPKNT